MSVFEKKTLNFLRRDKAQISSFEKVFIDISHISGRNYLHLCMLSQIQLRNFTDFDGTPSKHEICAMTLGNFGLFSIQKYII